MMKTSNDLRTDRPRCLWLIAGLTVAFLLLGSPFVLRGQTDPTESAEVAAKVEQLENASRQAGLGEEERKAVIGALREAEGDKRKLVQALTSDTATAIQKGAFDKLVRMFGHPLEDDLCELREHGRQAGWTAEETAAAEKLAVRTGFNDQSTIVLYETGKMSAIEKSAFEKLLALRGHPKADQIEQLKTAGEEAGLSAAEIQTLRGLAARAGWELDQIVVWKLTRQLSEAEAAAVAKLETGIGPLGDGGRAEGLRTLHQLAQAAGCTDQEASALLTVLKKGEVEDLAVIAAVRSGQHSEAAATGLKKLESLLGKIEDFAASSCGEKVEELLRLAATAKLTAEETGTMLKLARLVNYDLDTAIRLKEAGRLEAMEIRILDQLLRHEDQ